MADQNDWVVDAHPPLPAAGAPQNDWQVRPLPNVSPPPSPSEMTPSQQRAYDYERRTAVDPRIGMFNQGVAMGFSDEADALVEQGLTAAQNLGRRLMGQTIPFSAQEAHDAALRVNREMEARQRRVDPQISIPVIGGVDPYELAGTFAAPWGKANELLRAMPWLRNSALLRALLLGTAAGGTAAAGATNGDVGERLAAVPGGMIGGGATGGILHGAGRLATSSPVRKLGGDVVNALARAIGMNLHNPEGAGRTVVGEMRSRLDPTGQRLEANAPESRGRPITSAEALGPEAMTHLKVTGIQSGQTPEALEAFLQDRAEAVPDRLVQDFSRVAGLNPTEVEGDFLQQTNRLRQGARPLYERAFAFQGPVTSDELTELSRTPAVRDAMRNAVRMAANERIPANEVGITVGPTGQETITSPTLRTWDLIKRGLDRELERYRDPVTRRLNLSGEGGDVARVARELRAALTDERQPWARDYNAALGAGGEPLRLESAFRDASNLMKNTVTPRAFQERWNGMSEAEREAFRAGIVNDVSRQAGAGTTRLRSITTRFYDDKLRIAFGEERGRSLIDRIHDERQMLTTGRAMQPRIGSQTQPLAIAEREQRQSIEAARNVMRHALEGNWGAAALNTAVHIFDRVTHDAEVSADRETRDVIGRLLMMPPSELAADLRSYAQATGRGSPTEAQIRRWIERMSVATKSTLAAGVGRSTGPPPYRSRALNQALAGP